MVEEKDARIVPFEGLPAGERTAYDKFVEDAVSEKVAHDEEFDPESSTRVLRDIDREGDPVLHVFGRDKGAVDQISNDILSDKVSVRRRPIGQNVDPAEEDRVVGPALEKLGRSVPRESLLLQLHRGLDGAREAMGLPSTIFNRTGGQIAEGVDEATEALREFSQGNEGGAGHGKDADKGVG